jgi:hypothetical protein
MIMGVKRKLKRNRRAKLKESGTSMKSAKQKVLERVSELDKFKLIDSPTGTEKMSEVILEFAAPLIETLPDDSSGDVGFENAVAIAIMIWNASLMPEQKRQKTIEEIMNALPHSDTEEIATVDKMIKMLLKRKKKHFAQNRRFIVDYEVSTSKNERNVFVVSTMDPVKSGKESKPK